MRFHTEAIRDTRTRFYIPVKKLLLNHGVENAEALIGNQSYQTAIHYLPPAILFPPGASIVLDFGKALHGGIRFNQICSPGVIRIRFGESVSECIGDSDQDSSRKDARIELPNCGMTEYGNTVFRFVQIINIGDIPIQCMNIMAVALERDLEVIGDFQCSDERLNQIWKTAVRTVHLCMQDFIYDGAKRDRIVWMGDMHPEIRTILCAFGDTSIIRDSFEYLMGQASAEQPMNGDYYTYSCWFIIGMWDYYRISADRDFIVKHGDYLATVLKTLARFISPDGVECVPEERFLDWPNEDKPEAKHAGIQALLYWAMQAGAKLLTALNRPADCCLNACNLLKQHIPDPKGRKAPAALLTLTGLANRRDVIEDNPLHDVSTFYGYYVLQAKETIPALELIRQYWGGMLDCGATSFWEDFDLDWMQNANRIDEPPIPGKKDIHADFGNYCYKGLRHSLSHGWSSGPAPFLSERILGVYFVAPNVIAFMPDLGDLEYASGKVPAPNGGVIEVTLRKGHQPQITLPPGIELISEGK